MFSPAQTDQYIADYVGRLETVEKKIEALDRSRTDCDLLVAAGGLDLYSTAYALARNPDARESNPLGFNTEARIAIKAISIPAGCFAARKLRLSGRDGWATGLTLANVAAHVVIAGLNFRKGGQ